MSRLINVSQEVVSRAPKPAETPRGSRVSQAIPPAGLLQLAGSIVLLGGAWPATKYAFMLGATPAWFAVGRAGLSGLAAFAALALLGRLRLPRRADLPAVFAVGLLQLAAFFALAHEATSWIPAGRTAILANTTTIWIVPLSLIVLGEAISPRRWIATGFGLAGVAVLVSPWSIDWTSRQVLIGHAFLLGAALAFAVAIVAVRARPPSSTMLELLPWCFGLATLVLLPLALLHAPGGGIGQNPGAWLILGLIGLVAGPVGTWCVMQASATLPAMVASIGFLATPAAGLLLAALWLGEAMTPALIAGSALILAGLATAAWPARR